jgi:nucleoside 2-deoxyribosyltransferase
MLQQVGVYLAGAMRLLSDAEKYDQGWRDVVVEKMRKYASSVVIFNPMDSQAGCGGKIKLFGKFSIEANAILQQDVAGILKADIVFMNLLSLDAKMVKYRLVMPEGQRNLEGKLPGGYPHIGTLAELGIAYANHKLLVVLATNPVVTEHPFVRSAATRILPTLDEGITYLQGLTEVLRGSGGEA